MAAFRSSDDHWLPLLVVLCLLSAARSDVSSDEQQCSDQLAGLLTCLSYVQGIAKAPTPDCCSGLKQVVVKSPKCLCVLIKDRDDPKLGIKFNVTLAIGLPSVCSVPANISECPKLLNLPPNSTEAQIFEQGAITTPGKSNSTSSPGITTGTSTQASSSGSTRHLGGRRWMGVERVVECLLFVVPFVLPLT